MGCGRWRAAWRVWPAVAGATGAGATGAGGLAAQAPPSGPGITLVARRADAVSVQPGATLSAVLVAANRGAAAVTVTPHVTPPAGWALVTGGAAFDLAPGGSDPWVVALAVPADAGAGSYVIPIVARLDRGGELHDSVRVHVTERHAVAVAVADAPDFAVDGREYRVRFTVRNLGNVAAALRLRASSSAGPGTAPDAPEVALPPGTVRIVSVRVPPRHPNGGAMEDVVELTAVDRGDASVRAAVAVAVAVVPKPGDDGARLASVPADMRVRAGGREVAVSPLEISGGGTFDGRAFGPLFGDAAGALQVDFLARAPVRGREAAYAPFADRDEYRLTLRTPRTRLRLGDQVYDTSPLTGGGAPGFGAALDVTRGRLGAGAYVQRARWVPTGGGESGAFVTVRLLDSTAVTVRVADRADAATPGRVAGAQVLSRVGAETAVAVEYAGSDGPLGRGAALDAHLTGRVGGVSYDVARQQSAPAFAGPQRGRTYNVATIEARPAAALRLSASANTQRADVPCATTAAPNGTGPGCAALDGDLFGGLRLGGSPFGGALAESAPPRERFSQVSVTATILDRFALDLARTARHEAAPAPWLDAAETTVRARVAQPLGSLLLTANADAGRGRDALTGRVTPSAGYGLGAEFDVGARQHYRAFLDVNDGHALGRLGAASPVAGVNATVGGPFGLRLSGSAVASRARPFAPAAVGPQGAPWTMYADARLDARLWNGDALGVRAHRVTALLAGLAGRADAGGGRTYLVLEYGRALRLPAGLAQAAGRARGRVVDAETGRGIADALVRVGGRTAVTDHDGQVRFAGLAPGEHAIVLASGIARAGALAVGDHTVHITEGRGAPADFQVAMARGGRVRAVVRRFALATTSLDTAPDPLVDAGLLADVPVTLAGERDTLVRTTRADGTLDFGEVATGRWTVAVDPEDVPPHYQFERARLDVHVDRGGMRTVEFRLVPRRRAVRLLTGVEGVISSATPRHPVEGTVLTSVAATPTSDGDAAGPTMGPADPPSAGLAGSARCSSPRGDRPRPTCVVATSQRSTATVEVPPERPTTAILPPDWVGTPGARGRRPAADGVAPRAARRSYAFIRTAVPITIAHNGRLGVWQRLLVWLGVMLAGLGRRHGPGTIV